jgi:hypothetical protein
MRAPLAAVLLSSLWVAAVASADVVTLTNGDRVSGKIVSRTAKRVRLQTPYGLLLVPRDAIARIQRDDGAIEVLNEPPAPQPLPPPPPEPAQLRLVVSGASFWQAWDPKSAPPDPSLRLALRLDGGELASYTDATLDPEDLPKAVVNSFVFAPDKLAIRVAEGIVAGPPVVVPGEIGLPLKLPAELAGRHRLSLAYQVNEGTVSAPQWRDVVSGASDVVLEAGRASALRIEQGRGTMEYTRRKMRNVETFTATLQPEPALTSAP